MLRLRSAASDIQPHAGNSTVLTNSTGYATAAANFTNPGNYNASATYLGNTSLSLPSAVAFSRCVR